MHDAADAITRQQAEALATTAQTLARLLAASGQSALQLVLPIGPGQQLVLRAFGGQIAEAIVEAERTAAPIH